MYVDIVMCMCVMYATVGIVLRRGTQVVIIPVRFS